MNVFYSSAAMDAGTDPTAGFEKQPPNRCSPEGSSTFSTSSDPSMPSSYYYPSAPEAAASYELATPSTPRSESIKSEEGLDLQGPLHINGSVKSGGSINLTGDFQVKEKIDAYGAINLNGNLTGQGRIKAYGNIEVNGKLIVSDKIKGFGKLKIVGALEGTELEIYGNLIVDGYLHCKKLVVFGSLTLIGDHSSYSVTGEEEVAGAKLRRDQEADWDY